MDYIPSNIQKNWMGLMEYSWDIHGVFLVFFFSSLGQPYRTVAGWIFRYWPSKKRGCQPMNRGIYTKINCRNQQMAISKCRAWSLFILFFGGWFSVKCQLFDLSWSHWLAQIPILHPFLDGSARKWRCFNGICTAENMFFQIKSSSFHLAESSMPSFYSS